MEDAILISKERALKLFKAGYSVLAVYDDDTTHEIVEEYEFLAYYQGLRFALEGEIHFRIIN